MTYALIVPVYLNFEGYTRLMASINEPCVPIVVDNYIKNRGVAAGWNHGLKKARDLGIDRFVVSNDDIIFKEGQPSWLINELDEFDLVLSESSFACFAINQRCLDEIGYFDEAFWPAYFEDNDFHHRFKVNPNVRQTSNIEVKLEHKTSSTQFFHGEENRVVSHEMFDNNKNYFIAKWGGTKGEKYYKEPFNGEDPENFMHLINKRP